MSLIVEFNVLSKSGLGIEIGQLCASYYRYSYFLIAKPAK
jgi:hypothetical protein